MNVFVICDGEQKETQYLKEISQENIARVSEETWRKEEFLELEPLKELLAKHTECDVLYLDVTMKNAIAMAEQIRKDNKDTIFLLIADTSISPMAYLKPSIQAASLLLRPLKKKEVRNAVTDTWNLYQENFGLEEERFVVDVEEERMQIPFRKICYFSSNAKKFIWYWKIRNLDFTIHWEVWKNDFRHILSGVIEVIL